MKNYIITPLVMLAIIPLALVGFIATVAFLGLKIGYSAAWDFIGWITE